MAAEKTFTITLPENLARLVEAKVSSGAYATPSDVILDGLRELEAQAFDHDLDVRSPALDRWLLDAVAPAYDAYHADPSSAVSIDDAFGDLKAHYLAGEMHGT
jgi:Arc/MetJ-type ribon-helix-helix transcriptional regulator